MKNLKHAATAPARKKKVRWLDLETIFPGRTQARQNSPDQRGPAAPAAPASAGGFPPQFPPHLLLLGLVAFLLYTALYIVDILLLRLTFVPGNAAPWLSVLRIALRKKTSAKDVAKVTLAMVQVPWRVLVGSQYRPGAAILIRTVDALIVWSFRLDIAALCTAALLVCWMRRHDRLKWRRRGWLGSVLQFVPTRPWSVLAVLTTAVIFWTPPEIWSTYRVVIPASLMVFIWSLVEQISGDKKSLIAHIPTSCYWQMALSMYRLRSLDPYEHQVHTWAGLLQILFLLRMLSIVKPAIKYCHRYISRYGQRRH